MNPTSTALLLLAAALPLSARPRATSGRLAALSGTRRSRSPSPAVLHAALAVTLGLLTALSAGLPLGPIAGAAVAAFTWSLTRRRTRAPAPDPLALAAAWDLLAACLRAGLPVATAVTSVADDLPGDARRALRATADLLALGADPADAWLPALHCPHTAALARGARHTTRSGTALADIVGALATSVRADAGDEAETRAQRAGVLIAAPLGLCFLPAFICLGIVPVVAGLAAQLSI
ncbi:type II secretion system F family protein [Actinophytocola gossypii]|uniref:Type II secretion system F family protein n=1 Tax=Actinophytocola gossypii TaxID=2812003 RepID=A0ABT2J4I3_9PSEU|nr:type II secretion system F family protein [Actinophytocola gossypii]MCT2582499.1 type II secretion system F family protein [Actinophytocola gossypii]